MTVGLGIQLTGLTNCKLDALPEKFTHSTIELTIEAFRHTH